MSPQPPEPKPRRTLTEYCGVDPDMFDRYLDQKQQFLMKLDETALARIQAALESKLAWVA